MVSAARRRHGKGCEPQPAQVAIAGRNRLSQIGPCAGQSPCRTSVMVVVVVVVVVVCMPAARRWRAVTAFWMRRVRIGAEVHRMADLAMTRLIATFPMLFLMVLLMVAVIPIPATKSSADAN